MMKTHAIRTLFLVPTFSVADVPHDIRYNIHVGIFCNGTRQTSPMATQHSKFKITWMEEDVFETDDKVDELVFNPGNCKYGPRLSLTANENTAIDDGGNNYPEFYLKFELSNACGRSGCYRSKNWCGTSKRLQNLRAGVTLRPNASPVSIHANAELKPDKFQYYHHIDVNLWNVSKELMPCSEKARTICTKNSVPGGDTFAYITG